MNCPQCGGNDWKEVSEMVQQQYRQCANCKYTPSFDKAEEQNASEWLEALVQEHTALAFDVKSWQEKIDYSDRPSTLTHGRLNKAKRLLEANEKKLLVAEHISQIVEAFEEGQITLQLPELGTLVQFTFGNFNLFKSIAKARSD